MKKIPTLKEVERFMAITGWGPTRFGREAMGDTKLVPQLRAGRRLDRGGADTIAKFMTDYTQAEAEKVKALRSLVK